MYFINDFFVDSALQFDQRINLSFETLMTIELQIIENKDDKLHFFTHLSLSVIDLLN